MISKSEIEKLILSGDISISYTFSYLASGQPKYLDGEQFVDITKPELSATRMFHQNYFAARFRLTLGPIVMTHDARYSKKRPLYKGRPGYTDLRESSNKIVIEPKETLSIATNERIILSGKIGSIILPRLRNVDSGLLYTASYVDPYWDGILQAVIINATNRRQNLFLCEGVAICLFYIVKGDVSEEVKKYFPSKSHHFGQTWNKILNEDAEPFPRRKLPVPRSGIDLFLHNAREFILDHWRKLVALGYTGGILLLAYSLGKFNTQVTRLPILETELKSTTKQIDKMTLVELPKIQDDIKSLSGRITKSGIVAIKIPAGKLSASWTFEISRSLSNISTVWVEPTEQTDQIATLKSSIKTLPSDPSRTNITINITLKNIGEEREILIKWLIAD